VLRAQSQRSKRGAYTCSFYSRVLIVFMMTMYVDDYDCDVRKFELLPVKLFASVAANGDSYYSSQCVRNM
jgi:hypothetical protein